MDEAQAPSQSSGGARCALHYGQPFVAVCQRCGTYMCQTCTEAGKFSVCPSCRSRTGLGSFPLRRNDFTWGELLRFTWDVYKRNWALLLVAIVIVMLTSALLQGTTVALQWLLVDRLDLLLMLQAALVLPQMLLQSLVTLGLMSIVIKLARGEHANLKLLVGEWRKLGSVLLQLLIFTAATIPVMGLFALLFGVTMFSGAGSSDVSLTAMLASIPLALSAFFYVGTGLAFASFEVIAQPDIGAIDGIRNSWRIAKGKRFAMMTGGSIAGAIAVLGVMACFIGVLPTYGFAMLLFASLYLTLRNGAEGLVA